HSTWFSGRSNYPQATGTRPLDQRLGHLEAPERLDLPLRRAVPDGVSAPQHMVGTKGPDDLAEQVGAGGGIGRDQLPEGGPQLHVEVREARLLLLHLAKLDRPGDVRGLSGRPDTEEPGVVHPAAARIRCSTSCWAAVCGCGGNSSLETSRVGSGTSV